MRKGIVGAYDNDNAQSRTYEVCKSQSVLFVVLASMEKHIRMFAPLRG